MSLRRFYRKLALPLLALYLCGPSVSIAHDSSAVQPAVNEDNSSSTPLTNGSTFTGVGVDTTGHHSVITAVKTDQDGTLYMEFSPDGVNWDSSLSYSVTAGLNDVHRLTITRRYYRTRFTNNSGSDQTYFRLQTMINGGTALSAPLNLSVQQDADAIVARTVSEEVSIAEGKFTGYSITNKFGTNADVDATTSPEDIWEGGGAYTGWATAGQAVQAISSSTDDVNTSGTGAWTVRAICLDSNYVQQTITFTLNGQTAVTGSGTNSTDIIRCHTAQVVTAGSGGVNAGIITIRQATTTTNIFLSMLAGRNQTNCSCFTVPAGKTAYMRHMHIAATKGQSGINVEGNIWTRSYGGVFRSRRPFLLTNSFQIDQLIYGGLVFTEKSDIILRATSTSTTAVKISAGYDLVLIDN